MRILPSFTPLTFLAFLPFFLCFGYTYCMDYQRDNPEDWGSALFPFTLLSENALDGITPLIEVIDCPPGMHIYNTGDIPDFFYWVLSGNVTLTTAAIRRGNRVQSLMPGDSFGAEVFSSTEYRLSRATCVGQTRLARINEQDLISIQNQYPLLKKAFSSIYLTLKHRTRIFLPWLEKEEKINHICRKHMIFLLLRTLVITGISVAAFAALVSFSTSEKSVGMLLLSVVVLLVGLAVFIWAALDWSNDFFILTSERVLHQKKITGLTESRHEAPFSAIISTELESSFWGRLLDYGTIHLKTDNGNLSFENLPDSTIIYNLLEYQRLNNTRETEQTEKDAIRAALKQRLEGGATQTQAQPAPRPANSHADVKSNQDNETFLDQTAHFMGLRLEKEGSVVFRTHWWHLVKKTALPSLLMLAVLTLVFLDILKLLPEMPDKLIYAAALLATVGSWGWWLYAYQDWYNDVYIITPDELIDFSRKPFHQEVRHSAPIQNVQTVEFKRSGLIGVLLNFGTVRIQIADEELTFDDVYNPAAIQAEIFSRFKRFKQSNEQSEQEKLADWIATYDEMRREKHNQADNGNIYR